jgi:molybdopterin-guanine dinucleotide biosynthesis protein A
MKLLPPSAADLMPSLSAVLLAGGKSERMGRDKALLPMPHSDELLWHRQLRILGELCAERIYWSGPPRPGIPKGVSLVPDTVTSAGPLAGVGACLRVIATDLLVVLAVDLPRMDASYLAKLTRRCTPTRGAVPKRGEDFEPLAAVYPAVLRELAEDRLHQGRYAMHDFVREAIRRELIDAIPVAARDAAKFANVNSPEDLAKFDGHSK